MITLLDIIKKLIANPEFFQLPNWYNPIEEINNRKNILNFYIDDKVYELDWGLYLDPTTFEPKLIIKNFKYFFCIVEEFYIVFSILDLDTMSNILSFTNDPNIIIPIEDIKQGDETLLYLTYGKFLSMDMTPYLIETIKEDKND